jgi:gliding motility-associated-like protein
MKNNNKMANFFKVLILAIVLGVTGSEQLTAQDNSGTEFWFSLFSDTFIDELPGVYIVSYYDCTVTIDYVARDPALDPAGLPQCTRNVVNVTGGVPQYVAIPFDAQAACWRFTDDLGTPETVQYNGIKVTSTAPIALYLQAYAAASSELTPVFPLEDMGTDYIVSAYREITSETNDFNARTTVVGIEDNTEVTFTLPDYCWTSSTDGNGLMTHGPGSSWSVTLNEGETYTVLSNDNGQGLTFTPVGSSVSVTNNQGLNGMKVSATKVISVLGGTDCTWVGNNEYLGCGACDLTCTHLKPTSKWDTRFVTTQTLVRPNQMSPTAGLRNPPTPNIEPYPVNSNEKSVADYLIITAKEDATTINITGVADYTKTLDAGEWFIYESPGNSNTATPPPTTSPGASNHVIDANNPIQVVQLMKGWQCDNNNPADPTQMSVIEEAIWKDNYIVTNPTQYANNFFAFIVKEPLGNNVARNSLNLSVNGADLPIAAGVSATNNGTGGWTQIGTEPYFFQRVTFSTAGAAIRAKSVALSPGGTTYPFAFYASGSTNASSYGYMGGNVCQLKAFAHADSGDVCSQTPVQLILDSTKFGGLVGGVTNYTYSWIIDNGVDTIFNFSSIGLDPDTNYMPTVADTLGTYTGYLVITDNADCQAIDTFVVHIGNDMPIPTVGPDVTVCEGDTIFLSANSSLDEVTYLWSGPADFSDTDQNPIIPNATATMTGIYNVTMSTTVCTSEPVSVNVTVNTAAVIDSIPFVNESSCGAGDGAITIYATGTDLTYSIDEGATYGGSNSFTNLAAGTYMIFVNNASNCPVNGGVISISSAGAPPAPTANANPNPVCEGDTLLLYVSTTVDGETYNWSGPNSYSAIGDSVSIKTVTASMAGTYTVTAVLDGCTSAGGSVTITVNPNATITLTSAVGSDDQTICENIEINDITYSIGGGGTGADVTGLPPGVTGTFNSGMFTISGTPSDTGTFNYTVTTTSSCMQTTATGSITVSPDATITLSSAVDTDNQTLCKGSVLTAITYAIGGSGTGATVSGLPTGVTGSFDMSSGTFTISGTPTNSDTFNYTVTTTGNCSNDSATGTITVNSCAPPVASFTTSSNTICEGSSIVFSDNSTGTDINTWNWTFNGGTPGTANTVGPHTVVFALAGTYSITLQVADDEDTDDTTMVITVNANTSFSQSFNECQGFSVTVGSNTYISSGTYSDTLTNSNGCDSIINTNLTINPTPLVTLIIVDDNCAESIGSINTNIITGTPPITYNWNNGSNDSILTNLPTGTYTLSIIDSNGCINIANTTLNDLEIDCAFFTYIPNGFTPNNDGNNDVLYVRGKGIASLYLSIYNRWGNKIFDTTKITEGWDGKYKGQDQDQGVFVYVLNVTSTTGKQVKKSGNVSLIR